ncbi:MAG: Holliday junction branch migration protein RuvA [Bacteroidetes bacterium]|nr:MAG: Holliday junction branch migration protein RuvA [Bacteroidota bacterium]
MIAFIEGEIAEITPAFIVINCNGVGYMLHISLNTYSAVQNLRTVKLHTEMIVREDAHTLYGFATADERTLFRYLISVNGVGPNTARVILSSMTVDEVSQSIVGNNSAALQAVKGIGAKTAQRIVLDLKDKLEKEGVSSVENLAPANNTIRQEALSALVMLGYNKAIAQKTLNQVLKNNPGSSMSVEQLIKEALKYS